MLHVPMYVRIYILFLHFNFTFLYFYLNYEVGSHGVCNGSGFYRSVHHCFLLSPTQKSTTPP